MRRTTLSATIVMMALSATLLLPGRALASHVTALLETNPTAMAPGEIVTVTVRVPSAGSEFNAFQLSLQFNPDQLDFVEEDPLSSHPGSLVTGACGNLFHVLQPGPDSLKASVSLLCAQTYLIGPGAIYQFRFAARNQLGVAYLALGPSSGFYRAGTKIDTLVTRPVTIAVGDLSGVGGPGDRRPSRFAIRSIAPVPARSGAVVVISFSAATPGVAMWQLFDSVGRRVGSAGRSWIHRGESEVRLTIPAVAPGVYFMRLTDAAGGTATRRLVVRA